MPPLTSDVTSVKIVYNDIMLVAKFKEQKKLYLIFIL